VTVTEGSWQHITYINNGSIYKLYKNGVYQGQGTGTYGTSNYLPLIIGTNLHYGIPYKGDMDEFRLYNRSLTEAEITELYIEGFADYDVSYDSSVVEIEDQTIILVINPIDSFAYNDFNATLMY
jgi:hypothetical protein